MIKGLRHMVRFVFIMLRLMGGGVSPWRRRPVNAARLTRTLERLGPSFVKLGQTLSTRADLIGGELAEALASLRDDMPPFPTRIARKIIREDLGKRPEELFAHFPDAPMAAASVAQVYKAVKHNGSTVAVKIVRPGVQASFRRDIELFLWAARLLERHVRASRRLRPLEVVRTLERSVAFELDLRYEAAAIDEMAENIQADHGWRVPAVDWMFTSGRVMVTQWMEGTPIHDVPALLAAGHDPNVILSRFAEHFFKHAFRDGFFHADLHPGNVFVDAEGNIAVVDFGITGRLAWKQRIYVAEIFRGFLEEDYRHVAEMHFKAGYVPAHHSVEEFAQACRAIAKPILGRPLQDVSLARLLGQLFTVTETFEMQTQPQLLMLQKTLVVVEGVGRMLNPDVNMWEMARPPIEEWAREHMGLRGHARHLAWELRDLAQKLPLFFEKLEWMMERQPAPPPKSPSH